MAGIGKGETQVGTGTYFSSHSIWPLLYDSISRVWPSGQRNKEQSKKSHSRVNQSILYKIQYNNIVINIIISARVCRSGINKI